MYESLRRDAFDDDTQEQLNRVTLLAEKRARGFLPVPAHLRAGMASYGPPAEQRSPQSSHPRGAQGETLAAGAVNDTTVVSSERSRAESVCLARVPQLHSWFARIDNAIAAADSAEEQVESIRCRVETLLQITAEVHKHSDAISVNASALMSHKARLERTLAAVASAMQHFNRVDELLTEVSHPGLSATSVRFPVLLEELEDTAVYLSRVHRYKSAKAYSARLSMAYQRAMLCLRDSIVLNLQEIVSRMMSSTSYTASMRSHQKTITVTATDGARQLSPQSMDNDNDADETLRPSTLGAALAALNEDFVQRVTAAMDGQLRLIEARCTAPEAEVFVSDVFAAFADVRSRLIAPLLADYGEPVHTSTQHAGAESAGVRERAAMALLIRNLKDALEEERRVFDRLWLSDDVPESAFDSIANDIADVAYQQFRAALLQTDELEQLCALCSSLTEGTGQLGRSSGSSSSPALTIVKRMVQDTQERIVFRTSVFIRHKIAPFPYTAENLWNLCNIASGGGPATFVQAVTATPRDPVIPAADRERITSAESSESLATTGTHSIPPASPLTPHTEREPAVFLPVDRCIELLNMLYPAVERGVFAVFADDCVHIAVESLLRAAKMLVQFGDQHHHDSASTTTPAALRLVSRGHLSRLWSGLFLVRHLLRLREALTPFDVNLTVIEKGLNLSSLAARKLELVQSSRESRRDVESELRTACEDVIEVVTSIVTAPLASRLPADAMSEAQLVDHVERVVAHVHEHTAAVRGIMAAFIQSPASQAVLWRPVRTRLHASLAELTEQARRIFADFAPSSATETTLAAI